MTLEEMIAANPRRAELLSKKYRDSLSPEESTELDRLQSESLEVLEREFPRPQCPQLKNL
jgi:hypothetical protein